MHQRVELLAKILAAAGGGAVIAVACGGTIDSRAPAAGADADAGADASFDPIGACTPGVCQGKGSVPRCAFLCYPLGADPWADAGPLCDGGNALGCSCDAGAPLNECLPLGSCELTWALVGCGGFDACGWQAASAFAGPVQLPADGGGTACCYDACIVVSGRPLVVADAARMARLVRTGRWGTT